MEIIDDSNVINFLIFLISTLLFFIFFQLRTIKVLRSWLKEDTNSFIKERERYEYILKKIENKYVNECEITNIKQRYIDIQSKNLKDLRHLYFLSLSDKTKLGNENKFLLEQNTLLLVKQKQSEKPFTENEKEILRTSLIISSDNIKEIFNSFVDSLNK